jgi:AAA15 family ATPase/GTPase
MSPREVWRVFTEFRIKNFKSLRDVSLPISPRLTVFVGANNSGKSNAMSALGLLGDVQRRGIASQGASVSNHVKSMIRRGESSFAAC